LIGWHHVFHKQMARSAKNRSMARNFSKILDALPLGPDNSSNFCIRFTRNGNHSVEKAHLDKLLVLD